MGRVVVLACFVSALNDKASEQASKQSKWGCGIHATEGGMPEMGWLTGLEPATTGITIRDSTN